MKRNPAQLFGVTLRGILMGAADVVPGVSGGTIAFITGIYEELINSLRSINPTAVRKLFSEGPLAFWAHINGTFLVALFVGVGASLVTLAKAIKYLLANHPIPLWAFFFGLILASALVIGRQIPRWNIGVIFAAAVGTAVAFYVTVATPAQTPEALWFVFLAGMIAICAMILPGISGSFILLLMGKYALVIGAISDMDVKILAVFGTGCIIGLLSFSHVLGWMFRRFRALTIALLCGFMVGSLNKVWPWKITTKWRVNSKGDTVPFLQESVLPDALCRPQLMAAIALAVVGFALILVLARYDAKRTATGS